MEMAYGYDLSLDFGFWRNLVRSTPTETDLAFLTSVVPSVLRRVEGNGDGDLPSFFLFTSFKWFPGPIPVTGLYARDSRLSFSFFSFFRGLLKPLGIGILTGLCYSTLI